MADEYRAKRRKLGLKESLAPLFDEFYQYIISLTNSEFVGHLVSLQDIKGKLERDSYDDIGRLVGDMRRVTKEVRKSFTEDAATKLKLYIERTIEPVLHAQGILKLYQLESQTRIQLNENRGMGTADYRAFDALKKIDRLKMFLRWPLPAIPPDINKYLRATASLPSNWKTSSKIRSNAQTKRVFRAKGLTYEVELMTFADLYRYSIHISKRNNRDRVKFVDEYVNKYLRSIDFDSIYFSSPSAFSQTSTEVYKEYDVERILRQSLYMIIEPLIEASLDLHREKVSNSLYQILLQTPNLKVLPGANNTKLTPKFGKNNLGVAFYDLNFKPDLEVGYLANFEYQEWVPVVYSGLGEVKYVTFNLESCIEDLKGDETGKLTEDAQTRSSLIKEVEDTLYKYTTHCVYLGVSRYVLTDYRGFLFVRLEYKKIQTPKGYGTVQSEKAQHIKAEYSYFASDDPYIRLYFLSFFAMSETLMKEITVFRELALVDLKAHRDSLISEQIKRMGATNNSTSSTGGETEEGEGPPIFFSDRSEEVEYDTLPSTSCSNDSNEMNDLLTPPDSRSRSDVSSNVYNHLLVPIRQGLTSNPGSAHILSDKSNGCLKFDETLFRWTSYVELVDVITEFVVIERRASQIVKVDSLKFLKSIFEENIICSKSNLPDVAILKVYDPIKGQILKLNSVGDVVVGEYTYQECIDYTIREVEAYCVLSEFSGDFLPRIYAYGRLSDVYPYNVPAYFRLCGGYLMIELLERDPHFKVTEDFFNKKILTLFEKMHSRDVIHNDVNWDNFVITPDGDFKIIDFGYSELSSSAKKKEAEMELVYERLGSLAWRRGCGKSFRR